MLDDDKLNVLADIFEERFSQAERRILNDIGETLKKTGDLTPSQAKKLQQMYTYGADVKKFTDEIAKVSGKSLEEIEKLYEKTAQEEMDWSKPFYDAKGVTQIPLKENKALMSMIESMAAVTKNELANLSRTTAIGVGSGKDFKTLGNFYKDTVDEAITAVATGVSDYKSVIKNAVKELGSGGLRVQYESGYTRRLDSAVRQNVLDGVSYIAQETAKRNGEEFGADGYEISAHSPCAPDHLPYQGKQYSKKEFDNLQNSLHRKIGEWNCRHIAYPIIMGISMPANTDAELEEMERYSNEKITIDGEEYTRYECTQIQRQLETKLRYAGEEKALYKVVGDDDLTRQATEKIRILGNKYKEVSDKAGLPTRAERIRIYGKTVDKSGGSGIIKSGGTSGAKKTFGWQDRHAELMYEEIRKRTTDCKKISENTIFTEKAVEEIKAHMFTKEHRFADGSVRLFDSDFEQAQAWDRLTKGTYTDLDVLMLKHEYVELTQMRLHDLVYEDAHEIANSKHNWFMALLNSGKEA